MVRYIVFSVLFISSGLLYGQSTTGRSYGVGGSFDVLNPVNTGFYMPGISAFVELPKNESIVPYGKLGYYLPINIESPEGAIVTAIDPMTNPYQSTTTLSTKINTISLEGGTRYYLGNDYDIGIAALLETKFRLLVSPFKEVVGDYDRDKYELDPTANYGERATSITLYIGFGGGIKYSQPWGTIFTTAGLDLLILGNVATPATSFMMFSMQIGYRRDFY